MSTLNVETPDNLTYQFFPLLNGVFNFKVRAANDAHIALTMGPEESDPMYEVFIGGWKNTKSVIRKNRTKPDVIEMETPDILNGNEYRSFWVRWDGGIISAGRAGEVVPFMAWTDPEPFPVNFVGVCTGWGASGTWQIEDGPEFNTEDKLEYKFGPVASGSLELEFCGPHNCHVCLSPAPAEVNPMYEFILGGWENTKSVIRYCREQPDKVEVPTPGLMSRDQFRKILIQWRCGRFAVRDGLSGDVIMEWTDPTPHPITHFGVRTGWGATGQWRIKNTSATATQPIARSAPQATMFAQPGNPYIPAQPTSLVSGGSGDWVDEASGRVPPNAVLGGSDVNQEPLYVARARHEGALIPGKLVASNGCTYIAWGGLEHGKPEYQVLVGNQSNWVPANGSNVPPNAVVGGESEDGEPLYVGRVRHEGSITPGKVQQSHGVCYISFAGQELGFPEYEVLLS